MNFSVLQYHTCDKHYLQKRSVLAHITVKHSSGRKGWHCLDVSSVQGPSSQRNCWNATGTPSRLMRLTRSLVSSQSAPSFSPEGPKLSGIWWENIHQIKFDKIITLILKCVYICIYACMHGYELRSRIREISLSIYKVKVSDNTPAKSSLATIFAELKTPAAAVSGKMFMDIWRVGWLSLSWTPITRGWTGCMH